NRYGRRDNIHKARIKILVRELGADEFIRQVEEEWAKSDHTGVNLLPAEEDRVAKYFAPPAHEKIAVPVAAFEEAKKKNKAFGLWVATNVHPHKVPGYGIVTISLKPTGGIPGDASADQMDAIADLADKYSFDEVRVTHEQNLVLPHVRLGDL